MPSYILVIDDDPLQCRILEELLENRLPCQVRSVESAETALKLLAEPAGSQIAMVLVDYVMPEMNGLQFIQAARPLYPRLPIVVVTAHSDISRAIDAIKNGANDFVLKQDAPERLESVVRNALNLSTLSKEVERLERQVSGQIRFIDIHGHSSALRESGGLVRQAADSDVAVLIEGESGTGKELFARAIHGESKRANKPFIAINCGAIPEQLAESILFGHEKGAFTGATHKTEGKFKEADGGTLFLDEISELKPELQVKLLRALQQREIDPVGGNRPVKIDVRVISACNRPLEEAVVDGRFRQDLFYRLNVFPIRVPPLRERKDDIPLLAEQMRVRYCARENRMIHAISPDVLELFKVYEWPGNIRQLENVMQRAVLLARDEVITLAEFPEIQKAVHGNVVVAHAPAASGATKQGIHLCDTAGNVRPLYHLERDIIQAALSECEGCVSEVARKLKISRSTLYRKMADYDIQSPVRGALAATAAGGSGTVMMPRDRGRRH